MYIENSNQATNPMLCFDGSALFRNKLAAVEFEFESPLCRLKGALAPPHPQIEAHRTSVSSASESMLSWKTKWCLQFLASTKERKDGTLMD